MSLYLTNVKLHFKATLEYKLSFILSFFGQLFVIFTQCFTVLSLFTKFSNVRGYTLYEVLLTFSIIHFGFSFNEMFSRGIDQFDDLIIRGEYDRLLLRPKNILLQVLCSKIDFTKSARLIENIGILIFALIKLKINWTLLKVLTLIFMIISSISIFFSLFLLMASYCFITVQGLEVRNIFTDGGKNIAQYPMGIFNKYVRNFFTFIIPYSLINYYPLLYLFDKVNNVYYVFLPLIALLYIIPSILVFNLLSKKYMSTGS